MAAYTPRKQKNSAEYAKDLMDRLPPIIPPNVEVVGIQEDEPPTIHTTIQDAQNNINSCISNLKSIPRKDGNLPDNIVQAIAKLQGALIKLG